MILRSGGFRQFLFLPVYHTSSLTEDPQVVQGSSIGS